MLLDATATPPIPPDIWMSFLHAMGPRRVRLISVQALLTLACGREVDRQQCGEAVHKWLRKHWSEHLTRPSPGRWQLKRPHDLLPMLGLANQAEYAQRLRRLLIKALEYGLEAQHLAALVYGLKEDGITRSELHQRPWTAKRHRGEASITRYGYMQQLVVRGLMQTSLRTHRGTPITVWHTTPKGRELILGEWMQPKTAPVAAAPVLKTARAYSNLNAA